MANFCNASTTQAGGGGGGRAAAASALYITWPATNSVGRSVGVSQCLPPFLYKFATAHATQNTEHTVVDDDDDNSVRGFNPFQLSVFSFLLDN